MYFHIVDNKLVLNLEYILFYDEFKKVYDMYADKGTDEVEKVFRYIYEIADYRSFANRRHYEDDVAHDHAINVSGLSQDFKITNAIKKAIALYKKDNYSVNSILLKDLQNTLHLSIKINEKIQKVLESKITNPELKEEGISNIITLQGKLFEIIDGLPDRIDKVKKLEATVNDELKQSRPKGRGGSEIPASYDGDPEIEGEL